MRATRLPAFRRCQAVQAPNTPPPTTATSWLRPAAARAATRGKRPARATPALAVRKNWRRLVLVMRLPGPRPSSVVQLPRPEALLVGLTGRPGVLRRRHLGHRDV